MAAAAIPALLESAPAIISGAMMARDLISKYAPSAKKIVGMLFKSHSKSPSHLLNKLQNINPTDVINAASAVNKFANSKQAAEMYGDAKMMANTVSSMADTSSSIVKKVKKGRRPKASDIQLSQLSQLQHLISTNPKLRKMIPPSYHSILEQLK